MQQNRLEWVADFAEVQDKILKFAPTMPVEKTEFYVELFREKLAGLLVPTSSGHGSVDLILSECHKTFGLKMLVERLGINPDQCVAFGDGGNDIEMLEYCGLSYAMDNATEAVKQVAKHQCPSNDEDGVLVTLDRLFPNT
ncbi:HAD hydrolase, family IIB [Enterococcus faecium EnGen0313]|nr:HAD hydrolase, family IIB [Enterococcus faecium EnGen0182]EOI37376.1 HAD hydrolase, family IIB [Enterococcus faecium EnGen0313]